MCEFCENEKNLSITNGIIKIEKNRYSPSGYLLIADNSGEEYGRANCPIWFCPMCGRKLTDDEESKSTEELLEEFKDRFTSEELEEIKELSEVLGRDFGKLWNKIAKGYKDNED